jgi:hypothetical protein
MARQTILDLCKFRKTLTQAPSACLSHHRPECSNRDKCIGFSGPGYYVSRITTASCSLRLSLALLSLLLSLALLGLLLTLTLLSLSILELSYCLTSIKIRVVTSLDFALVELFRNVSSNFRPTNEAAVSYLSYGNLLLALGLLDLLLTLTLLCLLTLLGLSILELSYCLTSIKICVVTGLDFALVELFKNVSSNFRPTNEAAVSYLSHGNLLLALGLLGLLLTLTLLALALLTLLGFALNQESAVLIGGGPHSDSSDVGSGCSS